ncbi:MAG: ROK family protein [Planctomycetota bacterium]
MYGYQDQADREVFRQETNMSTKYTIGIDLGGTNIKGGICDQTGTLLLSSMLATEAAGGVDHVFKRMLLLVEELLEQAMLKPADIAGIGLGTPGPLSRDQGLIYCAPNLPGWTNIPVRACFSEMTGLPVILENDANAAAYGEFVAGAARSARTMVMLTLGTGVGGGVVLDGHLWRGSHDSAGEIGHMILVPDGRPLSLRAKRLF